MENIKKQIDMLVKYDCDNFEDLKKSYSKLGLRINEGLNRMKETLAFSEDEIAEMTEYAKKLSIERYEIAKDRITEELRKSFEF